MYLLVENYAIFASDRDVAPEGSSLAESNANLDTVSDYLLKLQEKYDIKLLWATQNLFSHPRYMNGAFTNPDAHVVAYAAAQTKKVVEINQKLKGENLVFWGGKDKINLFIFIILSLILEILSEIQLLQNSNARSH